MPDGSTSQIRKGRKFDQVLAGAREAFLASGFEGATVDDIARRAGVSKATLYSYVPDKRLLFLEVAKAECARQADAAMERIDMSAPVPQVLRAAAEQIIAFIGSDFGLRIFRTCVGEAERFPGVAREFYESGPGLARSRIAAFLAEGTRRGEIDVPDAGLAADQFQALCKAGIFDRMVFHAENLPDAAEVSRTLDGAVDMFMARYGTARR